jgi:PKD repeat protein
MSLRPLLPSNASNWMNSWRPRPSHRGGRALRERLTFEPLEIRSLLSAGPMDSAAAIPSQPDYFIPDVPCETALMANPGNPSDVFLPDFREAADTAVTMLSRFDGQEDATGAIFAAFGQGAGDVAGSNAADGEMSPQEDGHRMAFDAEDGSQYVLEYSLESGLSEDGHTSFSRLTFTVEHYVFANALPTADAGGPYEIVEGDPLTLDASASSDADGDSLSYSWDLDGDGEFDDATGADPQLSWDELAALGINDDGTYTVGVQVDDGFDGVDQASATISVQNAAPLAQIEVFDEAGDVPPVAADSPDAGEILIDEGTSIDLVGTAIDPGTVDTHTFDWSVTRNGEPFASHSGQDFRLTPAGGGLYQVGLSVSDDDGGVGLAGATIEVAAVGPEVAIAEAPETVPEGTPIDLEADVVSSSAADTLAFDWSVTKNGEAYQSGSDAGLSFTPDDNGTYVVTLTVADDAGEAAAAQSVIEVTNVDPQGTIHGVPESADEGTEIAFDAVVTDPGTADTHTIAWQVTKDGEDYQSGSGESFALTPDDNGLYEVSLTVTDDDGGTSRTTSAIEVANVAPEATIADAPELVDEGTAVTVSGLVADSGSADTHTFDWHVSKNGEAYLSASGESLEFTPDDNGIYDVELTVTDDDGASGVVASQIDVENVAPQLSEVAGTPWLAEGESYAVSGNISDPGTADSFELAVDWGDGAAETFSYPAGTTGFNEAHQYASGGIYTVGLTLADDDLASAGASEVASVSGVGVHDGVLQVVGTQQSDIVFVDRIEGDQFLVVADFLHEASRSRSVDAAGINQIEIYLADGNDLAVVSDNVDTSALIDGGAGNDLIQGGRGDDVLLGGDGHDLLSGNSGRDLLVGGLGVDYLLGNLADDVVIGGTTNDNVNDQALLTMMDDWF